MRPYIILILSIFIVFGCRKKEKRTETFLEDLGAIHCFNGILDGDETGIDCGGSCEPCEQNIAPCNLTPNTLYLTDGWVYETKVLLSSTIDTLANGNIRFTAEMDNSSNGKIEFVFDKPLDFSKVYSGDYYLTGSGYKVDILYTENGWPDQEGSGTVYIFLEDNGDINFQSCDYDFGGTWNAQDNETSWFNLTFEI